MARDFSIQRGGARVVFGEGTFSRIAAEIGAIALDRVLVTCTPRRKNDADEIAAQIGARCAGVIAIAREHVPVATVTEALREAERVNANGIVAFGGGSAIGLAKAIALTRAVKVVAVPTTYSGSEMTSVYGTTDHGSKKTGRDERVRPALVIYDPNLLASLPRDVATLSMWNAMAHAVEALWANAIDRVTALAAEEALKLLASSLLDGDRTNALEGAYLAGAVFGDVGGGLHHKLCHVIGGMFALPHAATHAALLPHVIRFQREKAPHTMAAIARALGAIDPIVAIDRLAKASGAPRSLEKLGMPRDGIARVVDAIGLSQTLDREALTTMLTQACTGPAASSSTTSAPIRGPQSIATQPGFGSTHESEALPNALPRTQNTPRKTPYGLYPELLSGTPFTVRNADNSRMWMYRVRPSFSHGAFVALPSARFAAPLENVSPTRTRWQPLPFPAANARVDFVDGLITLGGAGDPTAGPGYAVHLYAANADMIDRAFSTADGDLLIVPQTGALECRTELGFLRAAPGSFLVIPRGMKFAIGTSGDARGWMLEVYGRRLRLPERGPIGSNGLADARHFMAPTASFEDRACPDGFHIIHKLGGSLFSATQTHSPFDVVAWHGNHAPFSYDLSLFNAMGSVTFDHPDPSILTVLTSPLDDHGRAVADFVVFPGRWEVSEHSFRPPFMHRNAATEINMVVRGDPGVYVPGQTFVSPLLTSHGVTTRSYDAAIDKTSDDPPHRIPDESLWVMFESALPFRATAWAGETPLVDAKFLDLFDGMKSRFDPKSP